MFKRKNRNEYMLAIDKLANNYLIKVIDVDLETDTFVTLKFSTYERVNCAPIFSDWINCFINEGHIQKDYEESFKKFVDLDFIKRCVKLCRSDSIKFKYKRSVFKDDVYRDASIVIIPSDKKGHVYIYVYDAQY